MPRGRRSSIESATADRSHKRWANQGDRVPFCFLAHTHQELGAGRGSWLPTSRLCLDGAFVHRRRKSTRSESDMCWVTHGRSAQGTRLWDQMEGDVPHRMSVVVQANPWLQNSNLRNLASTVPHLPKIYYADSILLCQHHGHAAPLAAQGAVRKVVLNLVCMILHPKRYKIRSSLFSSSVDTRGSALSR